MSLRSIFTALIVAATCTGAAHAQMRFDNSPLATPPQVADPSGVHMPDAPLTTTMTAARSQLGAGDLLEVGIFDVPELTQRVRVQGNGMVHLALIGDIAVSGQTAEDVRNRIRDLLVKGRFVHDPQVTLFVVEYAGEMAFITGEVNRPGAYALLRAYHLQDLIAAAGGLTQRASNTATLVRSADKEHAVTIDMQNPAQNNPEILPGDSVSIGLTGIVYVLGNVQRPGGFLLDRRTTLTVLAALALAEGPTQTASLTKDLLLHPAQPDPTSVPLSIGQILKGQAPDFALQPGDIIWVGDSQTRNLGRQLISTVLATASGVAVYASYSH